MKSTLNGVVTATGNGKTFSTNGLDLAVGGSSYSTVQFRGNLSEAILFGVDKYTSGDIASIRENVGDYFTQNTPLLDTYSGAAAAYSLRKLSSSYSGSAIRVRRSSDNTEQDIGFNVFGELDTVSLLAFAGTGDAFVKTWYCQSGNSNDATQTATGSQPKIVSSGAVIVENGKPAVQFDGTDDELSVSSYPFSQSDIYIASIGKHTDTTTEGNLYSFGNASTIYALGFNRDAASTYSATRFLGAHEAQGDSYNQTQSLFSQLYASSTTSAYLDGVQGTQSYTCRGRFNSNSIGGRDGLYFLNGNIQEIVIYDSDQSANRTNIESNIATFYDITL